jgi:hypothetical protein
MKEQTKDKLGVAIFLILIVCSIATIFDSLTYENGQQKSANEPVIQIAQNN